MLPAIGPIRPWADPTVLQLRRLPMHIPLSGVQRRSLDGNWSLELFASPDHVPASAITGTRQQSVDVAVPGNWTMQDLGAAGLGGPADRPQYTNVQMPFPGPPPTLPEVNPTGVYRRTFTLPASWSRRRTVLHVGGAESVHAAYINGEFVGYGTDSRLPSEYDVSESARAGTNELAIVVIRYSAHSYIEDQDQWWMAGLHRSVWVESRARTSIADVPIDVAYDPGTGAGRVSVRTRIDGVATAGWTVRTTLADPAGRAVGRPTTGDVPHVHEEPYVFEGFHTDAVFDLRRARPWSAERPDRYTVTVELFDPRGRTVQTEVQQVGVRSVEVRDRQLLVNGEPIWVFGVNRHDHHPDRGKAVTPADIRTDLVAMRQHNINAIRTSHYPNDDAFYHLCDELGFYVIDEANVESHAYNTSLCHDPTYRAAFVDRNARMVERDRNHPCVIAWSLGNESGYGAHHDAAAGWIRSADPSRILHYEGAVFHAGWIDGGRGASDLVCPMYPTIDTIRDHGRSGEGDRPLVICEYSHAMGNSNGSLADYWDAITSTPGLQGGFLWEWKDHTLRQRLPDGRVRLAYGGQFGDQPNDCNFVADGLMSADLEPHPAMREVAWVHRPVTVSWEGVALAGPDRTGALLVTNRRSFAPLADLRARWELLVDGVISRRGTLRTGAIAPGTTTRVPLPCPVPPTGDVRLLVRWELRADTWFAAAGHLVAWDEVVLAASAAPVALDGGAAPDDEVEGPEPCIFRAPVDNDGFKLMPELSRRIRVGGTSLVAWQDAGVDVRPADELVSHSVTADEGTDGHRYRHLFDVPDDLADLGRVGVTFRLPTRFGRMRWFGRGPHENYPDRNRSALLGVWEAALDELPYLVPQEFGLRTDCRWLELIDPATGERVRFDEFSTPLHLSATRAEVGDLYAAGTAIDLPPAEHVVVHLDVAHRGLGTASCGPDVLPPFRLGAGRFEMGYRVSVS